MIFYQFMFLIMSAEDSYVYKLAFSQRSVDSVFSLQAFDKLFKRRPQHPIS